MCLNCEFQLRAVALRSGVTPHLDLLRLGWNKIRKGFHSEKDPWPPVFARFQELGIWEMFLAWTNEGKLSNVWSLWTQRFLDWVIYALTSKVINEPDVLMRRFVMDAERHRAVTRRAFDLLGLMEAYRKAYACLLYTSPSPRDRTRSRMPSSA